MGGGLGSLSELHEVQATHNVACAVHDYKMQGQNVNQNNRHRLGSCSVNLLPVCQQDHGDLQDKSALHCEHLASNYVKGGDSSIMQARLQCYACKVQNDAHDSV